MKLFVKLLLAALVLALLLPFTILKNDQGKPMMSFSDIGLPDVSLPDMPSFGSASKLTPSISTPGARDFFYKWYDGDGNVQFTTEPPAEGIEYTVKGYDPDANVIQAVKAPEKEPAAEETAPGSEIAGAQPEEVSAYDPESVKKLMEDTKNIEALLNQRFESQNTNINQ